MKPRSRLSIGVSGYRLHRSLLRENFVCPPILCYNGANGNRKARNACCVLIAEKRFPAAPSAALTAAVKPIFQKDIPILWSRNRKQGNPLREKGSSHIGLQTSSRTSSDASHIIGSPLRPTAKTVPGFIPFTLRKSEGLPPCSVSFWAVLASIGFTSEKLELVFSGC